MENPRWKTWAGNAGDFANMLKAFIGSNYLLVSFSLMQSGLLLGLCSLVIIAALTDHCCQLIVKCKSFIITRYVTDFESRKDHTDSFKDTEGSEALQQRMEKSLSYSDIGLVAGGRLGWLMVTGSLFLMQYGICTAYFIFIANTAWEVIVPLLTANPSAGAGEPAPSSAPGTDKELSPLPNETDSPLPSLYHYTRTNLSLTAMAAGGSGSAVTNNTAGPPVWIPSLYSLIFIPVPVFIAFSLVRSMRQIAPFSAVAAAAIMAGFVIISIQMLVEFQLGEGISWFANWATFPIFFGTITSAYEGIGVVVPLHSSMDGNRHLFAPYLHTVILIATVLFGSFGTLGYLRNGDATKQLLNLNLTPASGFISVAVNLTLILAILFTFPMQFFPVVEIAEAAFFTEGNGCKLKSKYLTRKGESDQLLPTEERSPLPVGGPIPPTVSTWKRNCLRVGLVALSSGIAVACKDIFAYFLAFIGAIGGAALVYVLPCSLHLALERHTLSGSVIAKDVVIVVFGVLGGGMSVVSNALELLGLVRPSGQ